MTLWYQKRREDRPMCWYMLHLAAFRDTDLSPVPSSMQFWNTTAKLHKPCRGANFPGRISLSGTAYSCFIVISPFVAVRNIPIWAKMDSSRRTGNIPSSWYKRWRWTQFATAIIVSKGTGDRPDICRTLLLFGTRTCTLCPRKESLSSGVLPSRQMLLIEF